MAHSACKGPYDTENRSTAYGVDSRLSVITVIFVVLHCRPAIHCIAPCIGGIGVWRQRNHLQNMGMVISEMEKLQRYL